MAHFNVYVLVSGATMDIRRRVNYLMEPYHNEFDVEEYEAECCGHCGGIDGPDCEGCDGKFMTTWNPMCKLDWYAIWDSQHVLLNASKYPYNWTDQEDDEDIPEKYDYKKAVAPLETLDLKRLDLPLAIVTPSGEWHEMDGNWWSEDQDSDEWREWKRTAHDIYAKYPGSVLVVLNCHA